MKSVRYVTALMPILIACRFGGPSGNPSACVALPDDSGGVQSPCTDASDDGAAVDSGPADGTSVDVYSAHDAPSDSPPEASAESEAPGDGPVGDGGEGGTCAPPESIPVCDPVTNMGCTLLQCDVDITMSTPTGVCVLGPGINPIAENAACTQTSGSTPCQPDLSCFGGSCRRICFCDSDCSTGGECCSAAYATTGFKLCGACH